MSRMKEIVSFFCVDLFAAVHYEPGNSGGSRLSEQLWDNRDGRLRRRCKIDAFAYLPVQDFGNAFSIFTAQNFGAKQPERIRKGIRVAVLTSMTFQPFHIHLRFHVC